MLLTGPATARNNHGVLPETGAEEKLGSDHKLWALLKAALKQRLSINFLPYIVDDIECSPSKMTSVFMLTDDVRWAPYIWHI